jgi:hypothetical protein
MMEECGSTLDLLRVTAVAGLAAVALGLVLTHLQKLNLPEKAVPLAEAMGGVGGIEGSSCVDVGV